MSWYSKVAWSEGLFLRQHHLQQNDRYLERLVENRVRQLSPYPWGFAQIEIDRDLAQQNKFALRRASGIFQDGTPFDMPGSSPLPLPIDVPEGADKQIVWLTMPAATVNGARGRHGRGAPAAAATSATSRRSSIRPRACMSSRRSRSRIRAPPSRSARRPKPGFHCLQGRPHPRSARQDHHLRRDLRAAGAGHAGASGRRRLDRARHRLDRHQARDAVALRRRSELRRRPADLRLFHAADAQPRDQRAEAHAQSRSSCIPVELYQELLRISGELWTFSPKRLAPEYAEYDQDALETRVRAGAGRHPAAAQPRHRPRHPAQPGRAGAQRLSGATVPDRTLFRNATFVIEVAASKSR